MSDDLTLRDVLIRVQAILSRGYRGSHFDFEGSMELSEETAQEFAEKAWFHYRNDIPLDPSLSNVRADSKKDEMIETFKQSYLSRPCFLIDSMYVFYSKGKYDYISTTVIEIFAFKNHFNNWLDFMLSKELEGRVRSSIGNRTKFYISKGSDRDMQSEKGMGLVSVSGVSRHDGRDGEGFRFSGSASRRDANLEKPCIYFKAMNYMQLL